jgi:hypothetical protein
MTSDYLIAATTIQAPEQIMLGYTTASSFQLQLPPGMNGTSSVYVTVHIRDMLDGVTEFSLEPIIVARDMANITMLINVLQQSNEKIINSNPTIQLLSSGNPNTVAQVSISLFQVLNEMNIENIETAISSKYLLIEKLLQFSLFRWYLCSGYFDFTLRKHQCTISTSFPHFMYIIFDSE